MAGSPGAKVVGRLALKVLPDTSEFVPKLKAFAERVEKVVKIEIPVGIDQRKALAEMAALRAKLFAQAAKDINIDVGVDRGGTASKQVASLSTQLGGLSRRLPPLISGGGQFSLLLRRWGALLTIVGTLILALGPSLATLIPLMGGLVAGGVAMYLGWDRVKKLFESLAPQAAALKKAVGVELVKGLEPIVTLLGQKFFPVLQSGLTQMAGVLNRSFSFLGRWLTSAPGIARVGTAFDAISAAMEPFGQLLTPLVRLFVELSIAAAPALQLIGEALIRVTNQFASFLQTGQATDTITQSVKDVGNILSIIGQVSAAVFPAIFAGAKLVIGAIQAIVTAGAAFGPAFEGLGGLFNAILPTIQAIWTAVQPLIQALGAKLAEGFKAITPIVTEIGALFQQLLPILVPVAQFISTTLLGAVIGAIKGILTVVKGALQIIVGIINVFKGVLTGNWSLAWSGLVGILKGVWNVIKGVIQVLWNVGVIGVIRKGFSLLKALFAGGFKAIIGAVKSAGKGILNGVKSIGDGIVQAFKYAMKATGSIWKAGWNVLKSVLSAAWSALVSVIKGGVSKVISTVKSLPGKVKAVLNFGADLLAAGRKLMEMLGKGILAGLNKVYEAAKKVADKIKSLLPGSPIKAGPLKSWNRGGAGIRLMELLRMGMESEYGTIKRSLEGFSRDLEASFADTALGASLAVATSAQSNVSKLDRVVSTTGAPASDRPTTQIDVHPSGDVDEVAIARYTADAIAWANR